MLGIVVLFPIAIALFVLYTSNARAWLVERLGRRFGNAIDLLGRIAWRDAVVWWFAYALTWALLGAAFVTFVNAFIPVSWPQAIQIAGTVAAAYLSGYVLFFSPAGLGTREAVMIGLLSHVMPESGAVVVSVASRLWFTAAELMPLALIPATRDEP